ncbi:DUF58 domain-containing protein [Shewanella eurypsychrophilus]|uniref:DUF58 domain-containing protein n=1 Tax=Shewanella eurypsychrophilus TaxID=2593656 RepID=A0ABX8S3A8_9GAMM|nr:MULTISPECIES: DUF58 domain-containing protein [Shewanella]QXP45002.1 DUF58 domain-containing protein [Shewanella eurypsychrophilus]
MSRPSHSTKNKITLWWSRWLARRLPPSQTVTLAHKSIFILPTGFGLLWIGLCLLLFLLGTNYQNNLVIGLSFLLISLFNTCIIYSYKNLAGLTMSSIPPPQAYAGETLVFPIALSSRHVQYEVLLSYPNNQTNVINTIEKEPKTSLVSYKNQHRGRISPARIKVESRYPLGLCRTWSHIDLDNQMIVFAHPIESHSELSSLESDDITNPSDRGSHVPGVDEFKGLRQHIFGESLRQVAWKQLAQGRGMLSKEFQQPQGQPIWLTLDNLTAKDIEERISKLTWSVDRLSERGQIFGLAIGQHKITPSQGEQHRVHCLQTLALIPSRRTD